MSSEFPSVDPHDARRFPSRVLLGIDFGPASLAAARWALANVAIRAEAILAHVIPAPEAVSPEHERDQSRELRAMTPSIRGGLAGFAATLGIPGARNIVGFGRPSEHLTSIAREADASLVVMGRRADAKRMRVGEPNVIERVARRSSASVLLVPEGADAPPARIIAAVDDSPFAAAVLTAAKYLARLHEIPLVIFHALSPLVGAYARVIRPARSAAAGIADGERPAGPPTDLQLPLRTSRWLIELDRSYNVLGQDRTEIVVGDPVRELTAIASGNDQPLVVVGMRGADGAPVGSVGSVSRELLSRAPMPVLLVNGP